MNAYARSLRPFEMLAALIAWALIGLPSIGRASTLPPIGSLVDASCDIEVVDDPVAARLRCARLRFLQVLRTSQPPASQVVATPGPARLSPALARGPAPPTPAPWVVGVALTSLLGAPIVGWRLWRRSAPAQRRACASAPVPGTRSTDITRRRLALQAIAP